MVGATHLTFPQEIIELRSVTFAAHLSCWHSDLFCLCISMTVETINFVQNPVGAFLNFSRSGRQIWSALGIFMSRSSPVTHNARCCFFMACYAQVSSFFFNKDRMIQVLHGFIMSVGLPVHIQHLWFEIVLKRTRTLFQADIVFINGPVPIRRSFI